MSEHTVTRQVLRTSGIGLDAYYAAPTFALACTCGWSAETTIEHRAATLAADHAAGNTEPTGRRITSTTFGTTVRHE